MRDSLPRVIFVDGLGVFGVGESLEKAHIVSELAETFAAVALKSESLGSVSYTHLTLPTTPYV